MYKQYFAVISDLHSNLEATIAVLEDIQNSGINEIYCLGDVIGYGPNPNELLNLTEKFIFTITGNHDEAVLNGKGLNYFNPIAAQAVLWTREEISYPHVSKELSEKNNRCLQNMLRKEHKDKFLFAHGSAISNMEYIFNYEDTLQSFKYMEENSLSVCFVGHTHRPGIFVEGEMDMIPYDANDNHTIEEEKKMIVNVGSVGQSRDNNRNACYLVVENNRIYYRRVKYDVDKTIGKIYKIDRLNNYLGDRLKT